MGGHGRAIETIDAHSLWDVRDEYSKARSPARLRATADDYAHDAALLAQDASGAETAEQFTAIASVLRTHADAWEAARRCPCIVCLDERALFGVHYSRFRVRARTVRS